MLGDMSADDNTRELKMNADIKSVKQELEDAKKLNKFVTVFLSILRKVTSLCTVSSGSSFKKLNMGTAFKETQRGMC